ncbi:MAG: hypothetical protein JKX85_15705 [Phycisphaeraceae bacterium]|nr:hypothetical protein [Phycisphaeraceae bacterium]
MMPHPDQIPILILTALLAIAFIVNCLEYRRAEHWRKATIQAVGMRDTAQADSVRSAKRLEAIKKENDSLLARWAVVEAKLVIARRRGGKPVKAGHEAVDYTTAKPEMFPKV